MTKVEFIQLVNTLRKRNKNKWVTAIEFVDGNQISYKAYNTWVQILNVNNLRYSGPMDISVKQFLDFLQDSIPEPPSNPPNMKTL